MCKKINNESIRYNYEPLHVELYKGSAENLQSPISA